MPHHVQPHRILPTPGQGESRPGPRLSRRARAALREPGGREGPEWGRGERERAPGRGPECLARAGAKKNGELGNFFVYNAGCAGQTLEATQRYRTGLRAGESWCTGLRVAEGAGGQGGVRAALGRLDPGAGSVSVFPLCSLCIY